ncbi:hypothetical protein FEM48_Zijuj11G0093200 [Ziziphus jujuba var. spinosa]|uniref:laccase n=1 Tax=Ziziphus jujuba var. spinosa TaxID=714518 RepID=A0A978UI41_ZIZJJ|nr:hypothetical protein FEM48_Zijuj11G0093200 [Ziziphus jujuba var. spinosa]
MASLHLPSSLASMAIKNHTITRLCHTKSIVSVNGKFPGPPLVAREGDRVIIKVVNHVSSNVTIHWYEKSFLFFFFFFSFLPPASINIFYIKKSFTGIHRSVYIERFNSCYPVTRLMHGVRQLRSGEWFNVDPEDVINQALQLGNGPNVSDAFTINDTFKLKVIPGKTYLLRIINAALNDELFFSIANHTLTVVEADAAYVKPFQTNILLIAPGQTTNVLLQTKPIPPNATFLIAASSYFTGQGTVDNTTTAAILEYHKPLTHSNVSLRNLTLSRPSLPPVNATKFVNVTQFVANFTAKFRSLANSKFPANFPKTVDRKFFFTVGLGTNPCPKNTTCQGPNGQKFSASVNNISFVLPSTAILQAYYFGQPKGVYTTDFPANPQPSFNYTGTPPNNTMVSNGTRAVVLAFNTSVEVVLQDTSILGAESHPLHLHGFNFFVVGQGFGNFDPNKDPAKFNLVDPVERNTAAVPSGGWIAFRFFADNPVEETESIRGVVYALSSGYPYELGAKNGMDSLRWTPTKPEVTTSTVRSS